MFTLIRQNLGVIPEGDTHMRIHLRSVLTAFIVSMGSLALLACSADDSRSSDPMMVSAADGTQFSIAQLDGFIDAQMDALDMPGLSVALIADGKLVYSAAKGVANIETNEPLTEGSVFEAASLSKPVFAYMVLKMVDQGLLDLDRPLFEYRLMPELEGDDRYHAVTARMALSHQTGFPNWRWFDPAPAEMGVERGTMYMKRAPGEFGNSGEGYNYLALIVADLLGRDLTTLDAVYQTDIAAPLGLSCSAFVRSECVAARKVKGHKNGVLSDTGWPRSFPEDTPQTFGAAGRLHTNARDYARLMIAMMDGTGLSKDLHEQMFSEQSQVSKDSDTYRLNGQTGWGLGLAIEPTPHGTRHEHGGNNGDFTASMMMFRDTGLGYVFLTNSDKGKAFNDQLEVFVTTGSQ